jgi:hypothetical protein
MTIDEYREQIYLPALKALREREERRVLEAEYGLSRSDVDVRAGVLVGGGVGLAVDRERATCHP